MNSKGIEQLKIRHPRVLMTKNNGDEISGTVIVRGEQVGKRRAAAQLVLREDNVTTPYVQIGERATVVEIFRRRRASNPFRFKYDVKVIIDGAIAERLESVTVDQKSVGGVKRAGDVLPYVPGLVSDTPIFRALFKHLTGIDIEIHTDYVHVDPKNLVRAVRRYPVDSNLGRKGDIIDDVIEVEGEVNFARPVGKPDASPTKVKGPIKVIKHVSSRAGVELPTGRYSGYVGSLWEIVNPDKVYEALSPIVRVS